MTIKRILVTGHTGYVGKALCAALDKENIDWIGVSKSDGGDLSCKNALSDIPACDLVIHLAGKKGMPACWENPLEFHFANVGSTINVMDYARIHKSSVIYLSTYMYGNPQYLPIDENHPLACNNPYAWTKREGEMVCEAYANDFNIPVTMLRLFNLFGLGQPANLLVPLVIKSALENEKIFLNCFQPKRDFLWLDDLISAFMAVIREPISGFEAYNLGSGESYSNLEVAQEVVKHLGPHEIVETGQPRPNEIMDCISDNTKFMSRYDWKPQVSFQEGIVRLIEDIRSKS